MTLALALIESGHQRHLDIELTTDYSCVRVKLHRGLEWTGEELHQLQEFLYEHGAKMRMRVDETEGPIMTLWPYNPDEEDPDEHS